MQRFFILFLTCFLVATIQAQDTTKHFKLSVSVFDNASSLPHQGFASIFKGPVHPGITLGTEFSLKKWSRTEWYQTAKLGYFYHRYVQHGIQLYSENGFRYTHRSGFGAFAQLGGGYMHSFADQEVFVFEDGVYKKKKYTGRPHFMLSLSPGIQYNFDKKLHKPITVFISYQAWLQMPYVREYVSILPNVALHLGVIMKVKTR